MKERNIVLMAMALQLSGAFLSAAAQSSSPHSEAATDTESKRVLNDIVVTATRREVNLQDVPVAVSAVSDEALASSGTTNVRELTFVVPGFSGGRNFSVLQPSIRGVGSTGNSPADEPNVSIYVDGIYQPSGQGNIVDFAKVDRVEVLRGPQGTLFGRNATGGLVNIITPDPKFTVSGELSSQLSRISGENGVELKGYYTGPITKTVAADLNVRYSSVGGYIKDIASGQDVGDSESFNIRTKLLFEPVSDFKSILTLGFADQRGGNGNIVAPLGGNTSGNLVDGNILPVKPNEVSLTFEPRMSVQQYSAALRNSWDLGAMRVETSSGYVDDKVSMNSDTDASTFYFSHNAPRAYTTAWNHEVRLLSQTDSTLEWIVGAYYFDMDVDSTTAVQNGVGPDYTTFSPLLLEGVLGVNSLAAFGEVTYEVTENLNLVGGVRYTHEERTFEDILNGTSLFPEQSTDNNKTTYRLTAQYFLTPNTNAYFTYSTGFKSGVFNAYSVFPDPVEPETIEAFELGLKSDPLSWLRTNISIFSYDYDNLQVTARASDSIATSTYRLLNAAKAEIRGLDLEVQASPTANLSLSANGEILDAEYDSFPNAQSFVPLIGVNGLLAGNTALTVDASGFDMIRAPSYTYSLNATWTHPFSGGELAFNGSLFGSAKVYHDFSNRLMQPAYTRLNAQISWTSGDEDWRLVLFGTNITDETIIQQAVASPVGDTVTYETPREVGIRIQRRF